MASVGRDNLKGIVSLLPHKTLDDVTRYHQAFWSRGPSELRDFDRLIVKLKKQAADAQKKVADAQKMEATARAFEWKMKSYQHPEIELSIKTHHSVKHLYTREQDNYLLNALFIYGLDDPMVYNRIHHDIL